MSSQPLYRIVYANGRTVVFCDWGFMLRFIRHQLRVLSPAYRPVRVERVSPAPRATGGQE